ncbi:hypothetical protein Dvina_26465 [Dactylosporangium vinaceum]|uniref:Uncharacterized protein n=1 Tax=Dactylosporangium vinaceum TaxID=53362 RepID=A0ABV5M5U1_9ACTN|nr:hypothetical protein [Dactylosporangium vinaceum]UAC01271.1 hypothetical protein Dvina_26465 [Dactylosporangium vinaceum]
MTTQGWGGPGGEPWDQALHNVQAAYRNARVTYTEPDEFADDSVTWKQLRPHTVRAGNVALVLSLLVLVIICCTCGLFFNIGQQAQDLDTALAASTGSVLVPMIVAGLAFVAWCVSLFFPIKEPIAEYSLLVENRAAAAPAVYGYMLQSAAQRALPFPMAPVRIAGQYLLSFGDTRLQSLVAVQTYGTDLYFGWTMWRSRSTVLLIVHALRDGFRALAGGASYRSAINGGRTRALREITHSITRLGVQSAIAGLAATEETNRLVATTPEAPMPPGVQPIVPPTIAPAAVYPPQYQQPVTGAWPQVSAPPSSAPPASGPPYGTQPPQ